MMNRHKKFIKMIGGVIVFLMGIFISRWILAFISRWILVFQIIIASIFTFWNPTNISINHMNITKITNKEEMFQFVIDNQEELDRVVCEMVSNYGTSDDRVTILYKYD